jgi:hypothetical protein
MNSVYSRGGISSGSGGAAGAGAATGGAGAGAAAAAAEALLREALVGVDDPDLRLDVDAFLEELEDFAAGVVGVAGVAALLGVVLERVWRWLAISCRRFAMVGAVCCCWAAATDEDDDAPLRCLAACSCLAFSCSACRCAEEDACCDCDDELGYPCR